MRSRFRLLQHPFSVVIVHVQTTHPGAVPPSTAPSPPLPDTAMGENPPISAAPSPANPMPTPENVQADAPQHAGAVPEMTENTSPQTGTDHIQHQENPAQGKSGALGPSRES